MAPIEYGYFIKLLYMLLPLLQLTCGFGFRNYKDPRQHKNWPLLNLEKTCGQNIWDEYKPRSFGFDTRIWGGETARKNQFPWVVILQANGLLSNGTYEVGVCDGSVINNRYVLTAAHCCRIEFAIETDFMVGLIKDNLNRKHYVVKHVEGVTIHEKYDDQSRNDICLVRLEEPLEFSANLRPICLPVDPKWENEDLTKMKMTAVGWGYTNEDPDVIPVFLQKVILPVTSIADCINLYKGYLIKKKPVIVNPETQFCAGNSQKDACKGDSGGPVMHEYTDNEGVSRYIQIGLVSFGVHCKIGKDDRPSILLKVSHYIPWILDNIYK